MKDGRARRLDLIRAARRLRREQTPAEALLWERVRSNQLGHRFRRQHVIGRFVVDFSCPAARLVVEIDGSVHDPDDARNQDGWRTKQLEDLGYSVIRLSNHLVLNDTDEAIVQIRHAVALRFNEKANRALPPLAAN